MPLNCRSEAPVHYLLVVWAPRLPIANFLLSHGASSAFWGGEPLFRQDCPPPGPRAGMCMFKNGRKSLSERDLWWQCLSLIFSSFDCPPPSEQSSHVCGEGRSWFEGKGKLPPQKGWGGRKTLCPSHSSPSVTRSPACTWWQRGLPPPAGGGVVSLRCGRGPVRSRSNDSDGSFIPHCF